MASVSVMLALVACIALAGHAEFRRAAELVETQPREPATFVELVQGGGRASDKYYVNFRGEEAEVDYGYLIQDPVPGITVDVVRDPENPDHIIVAGSPEDWGEQPMFEILLWGIGLLVGLITACVAGLKFVPERAEPVLMKLFDACVGFVRWVRRIRRAPD